MDSSIEPGRITSTALRSRMGKQAKDIECLSNSKQLKQYERRRVRRRVSSLPQRPAIEVSELSLKNLLDYIDGLAFRRLQ